MCTTQYNNAFLHYTYSKVQKFTHDNIDSSETTTLHSNAKGLAHGPYTVTALDEDPTSTLSSTGRPLTMNQLPIMPRREIFMHSRILTCTRICTEQSNRIVLSLFTLLTYNQATDFRKVKSGYEKTYLWHL